MGDGLLMYIKHAPGMPGMSIRPGYFPMRFPNLLVMCLMIPVSRANIKVLLMGGVLESRLNTFVENNIVCVDSQTYICHLRDNL